MEMLLAIMTFMRRAGGKQQLQRLLAHFLLLLLLVIITAIMVSAVLIGGLINAHITLLNSGMTATNALLMIGAAALFIIAILIAVLVSQIKLLQRQPMKSPLTGMLDAFTAGLMAEQEQPR